ncbi:MAG: polysaccharide pyruvyl transferase CsaB [Candidatus Margulisiibacteriota bacterium]
MKIALSGYYGFNNAGDEAVLTSIKSGILKTFPDAQISVLDRKNRFNLKMIFNCDILISGGGSLLQDKTSTRSFLYYLSIINLAKMLGKKVFIFAQGLGPITKWYNLILLKRMLNRVDLITVRDINSFNYFKSLKLNNPKIVETADPTFILSPENGEKILRLEGAPLNKRPIIGVSIRKMPDYTALADALDELCRKLDAQILFVPFQFPLDIAASQIVIERMKEKANIIFRQCRPEEIMGIIGQVDLMIGMRLHSLIFAVNCLVPALGLSYDPKVEAFMDEVDLPYLPVALINSRELVSIITELMDNRAGVVKSLEIARRKLRARAETNFGMLKMLLRRFLK